MTLSEGKFSPLSLTADSSSMTGRCRSQGACLRNSKPSQCIRSATAGFGASRQDCLVRITASPLHCTALEPPGLRQQLSNFTASSNCILLGDCSATASLVTDHSFSALDGFCLQSAMETDPTAATNVTKPWATGLVQPQGLTLRYLW